MMMMMMMMEVPASLGIIKKPAAETSSQGRRGEKFPRPSTIQHTFLSFFFFFNSGSLFLPKCVGWPVVNNRSDRPVHFPSEEIKKNELAESKNSSSRATHPDRTKVSSVPF